jgi:hypothetical protein
MMQENRAFDHYLGRLNGVRGFNDPRAVKLPGGNPVFYQPVVSGTPVPYVLPYHPTAPNLGLQFIEDLEHDCVYCLRCVSRRLVFRQQLAGHLETGRASTTDPAIG